jgi:hypothetical protein
MYIHNEWDRLQCIVANGCLFICQLTSSFFPCDKAIKLFNTFWAILIKKKSSLICIWQTETKSYLRNTMIDIIYFFATMRQPSLDFIRHSFDFVVCYSDSIIFATMTHPFFPYTATQPFLDLARYF